MYICICKGVTERHIYQAVEQGAASLKDLRRDLGVSAECGRCAGCANQCLKHATQAAREHAPVLQWMPA